MEKIAKMRRGKRDFRRLKGFIAFKVFEAEGLSGFMAESRIAGWEAAPRDVEVVIVVSSRAWGWGGEEEDEDWGVSAEEGEKSLDPEGWEEVDLELDNAVDWSELKSLEAVEEAAETDGLAERDDSGLLNPLKFAGNDDAEPLLEAVAGWIPKAPALNLNTKWRVDSFWTL
jgi:hypothetical protein